jgi:DNA-binding transcriptional LysR family regulator
MKLLLWCEVEFHQLRYFIAASEKLNISRAAADLHVSQPALSRQIGLLEEELGVQLFDRIRKRIHLTEAGRFFLIKARQLVCDAETSAQQVREQFGGGRRSIRLGLLPVFLDDLVGPAVREFRQRHSSVQVNLYELPPQAQLDRIRARELDAGILGNISEDDRSRFSIRRLSRHRLELVLPSNHALARRKSLRLAALKGERWVSLSNTLFPGRHEFLLELCQRAGFTPAPILEVDSLTLLLCAVAAGEGVAVLPGHAKKLPHTACTFVPMAAPRAFAELLLVSPQPPPDAPLQTLITLIAERAASLGNP